MSNALAGFGAGACSLVTYGAVLTNNGLELGTRSTDYRYSYSLKADMPGLIQLEVIPEPSSVFLMALGCGWMFLRRRRS